MEEAWTQETISNAGRKSWDYVLMFKVIMLCALNGMSDREAERQMADRFSFQRFLGLETGVPVPDENSIGPRRN